MRAVEQTRFNWPAGDCVRAAYAALIGVPIEEIPDFSPQALGEGANQLAAERDWLNGLGYDLVVVTAGAGMTIPEHVCHLISGLSPRGFGHRCIGRGGRLVWDPHPSHLGLVETWDYGFVVPLVDPRLRGADADLIGFHGWLS